ncbi:MAG: hypothetical protein NTX57_13540 [Armatimonadetes bacterium]|nr:hypothetical protein [Armatimonadota bacterium]
MLAVEEIDRRGMQLYQEQIASKVDVEENQGKVIAIDVESGDFEVADEGLVAGERLRERHPDASMLCLRIGYNAVYSFGGVLTQTKA